MGNDKKKDFSKMPNTFNFDGFIHFMLFLIGIIFSIIFKTLGPHSYLEGKYEKTTKENLIQDIIWGIIMIVVAIICCKLYVLHSS